MRNSTSCDEQRKRAVCTMRHDHGQIHPAGAGYCFIWVFEWELIWLFGCS